MRCAASACYWMQPGLPAQPAQIGSKSVTIFPRPTPCVLDQAATTSSMTEPASTTAAPAARPDRSACWSSLRCAVTSRCASACSSRSWRVRSNTAGRCRCLPAPRRGRQRLLRHHAAAPVRLLLLHRRHRCVAVRRFHQFAQPRGSFRAVRMRLQFLRQRNHLARCDSRVSASACAVSRDSGPRSARIRFEQGTTSAASALRTASRSPCGPPHRRSCRGLARLLHAVVEVSTICASSASIFSMRARHCPPRPAGLQLSVQLGSAAMRRVQLALRFLALLLGSEQALAPSRARPRVLARAPAVFDAGAQFLDLALAQQGTLFLGARTQHAHPAGAHAFAIAGVTVSPSPAAPAGRAPRPGLGHVQAAQPGVGSQAGPALCGKRSRAEIGDTGLRDTRGGGPRRGRERLDQVRCSTSTPSINCPSAPSTAFSQPGSTLSCSPTRAAESSPRWRSQATAAPCSWPSAACCRVSSEDRRPRASCACLRTSDRSFWLTRCWSCRSTAACLRVSRSRPDIERRLLLLVAHGYGFEASDSGRCPRCNSRADCSRRRSASSSWRRGSTRCARLPSREGLVLFAVLCFPRC